MKITIYANYGALAYEGRPLYTHCPVSEAYDAYNLTAPDGYSFARNAWGEILVTTPDGDVFLLGDILTNYGEAPAFVWLNKAGAKQRVVLTKYADKI